MIRTAAFFGLLTVIFGAFGAHLLHQTLVAQGTVGIWHTAIFYQSFHVLGLLWLGSWVENKNPRSREILICWVLGILFFSGSLYLLALTGQKWWGALTPLGGVGFLLGWAILLFSKFRP